MLPLWSFLREDGTNANLAAIRIKGEWSTVVVLGQDRCRSQMLLQLLGCFLTLMVYMNVDHSWVSGRAISECRAMKRR